MCDPFTLAAYGGSAVAGGAGALITGNSNLDNAQKQAAARNAVLGETIHGLDKIYNTQNAPAFSGVVSSYAPGTQAASLAGAQTSRGNAAAGNIVGYALDMSGIPGSWDAPPASRAALGSQLSDAFNFATDHAKAMGALGGYTDQWLNNSLAGSEAGRKIGAANADAENLKSLLAPEQDIAAMEASHRTSPWGSVLTGAGKLLGSAAGGGAFKPAAAPMNLAPPIVGAYSPAAAGSVWGAAPVDPASPTGIY